MNTRFIRTAVLGVAAALVAFGAHAQTIRIAYVDPLSGAFANTGAQGLAEFQFYADWLNKRGGVLG